MKLLDTNIFMYARGRASPHRDACDAVIRQAEDDPAAFGVDVEALQELLDVYSRRGERAFGNRLVTETLVVFPDPFPITRREIEESTGMLVDHARLSPRDAVHGAVVRSYGLEGIVSADKAFDDVPGLTRFDPLEDWMDLRTVEESRGGKTVPWEDVKRSAGLPETDPTDE